MNDKDLKWHIVRTLPNQERKLVNLFQSNPTNNIIEVYCPTHTTVTQSHATKRANSPLFAGYVFALSTHKALADFLKIKYPEGKILYQHRDSETECAKLWTVPDEEMKKFRDFNENYAQNVIVLERPYSDYAINGKNGEPNDVVKVIDGPLAGRTGYLVRFKGDRRLVFKISDPTTHGNLTVALPNLWNFHVVRLLNADGDKQTIGTKKARAVDTIVGMLQACGHKGQKTADLLNEIINFLCIRPSFTELRKRLENKDKTLARRLYDLTDKEAENILHLVRYVQEAPNYVHNEFPHPTLRPFLTPTPGCDIPKDKGYAILKHDGFTEVISPVSIRQNSYSALYDEERDDVVTYYTHVTLTTSPSDGTPLLICNWDSFLSEYNRTADAANHNLVSGTAEKASSTSDGPKLIDSFRNYAPTLFRVLTDPTSPVQAIKDFPVGGHAMSVMSVKMNDHSEQESIIDSDAFKTLTDTCVAICLEVNRTTHLAVWRRLLQGVWLIA